MLAKYKIEMVNPKSYLYYRQLVSHFLSEKNKILITSQNYYFIK